MSTETRELNGFVHRFVPAQSEEPLPTLLLLHGTGGSEESLLSLGRMLLPGAAVLSPRGKVMEHGMVRFFRRLAEGVFDIPDLLQRTRELADFVQAASEHYHFDARNVMAAGYSNGANIAASMLFLYPHVLARAILFHPMLPLELEQLPDLTQTPVFIAAGRLDPIVPASNTEQLIEQLQRAGAQVTAQWFNGGHDLSHEEVREAKAWLN
jgi:phospholipase/carboxylesterase/glyoxalase family protein